VPRKGIYFFATKEDMASGLKAIESVVDLKYIRTGLFDSPEIEEYSSFRELPNFGISKTGSPATESNFLLFGKDARVEIREVSQRDGSKKYAIDMLDNPDCLSFRPAGDHNGEYLIPGDFSPGEGPFSERLYPEFRKLFLEGFKSVKSYRVGQNALEKLESGVPLTPTIKADPEYYLRSE